MYGWNSGATIRGSPGLPWLLDVRNYTNNRQRESYKGEQIRTNNTFVI